MATDREVLIQALLLGKSVKSADELLVDNEKLLAELLDETFAKEFWGTAPACPECGSLEPHQNRDLNQPRWVGGTKRFLNSKSLMQTLRDVQGLRDDLDSDRQL